MTVEFTGVVWFWKGPAPWYFVTVPDEQSRELLDVMRVVTYGWGMIPANITIGKTEFYSALWPKDGRYIVPIKAAIRKAEQIEEGDTIAIRLEVIGAEGCV